MADNKKKTQLLDLTPNEYKCSYAGCPAVYDTGDGNLLLIGKKLPYDLENEIKHKVGEDEWAIIIRRDMLANVPTK